MELLQNLEQLFLTLFLLILLGGFFYYKLLFDKKTSGIYCFYGKGGVFAILI